MNEEFSKYLAKLRKVENRPLLIGHREPEKCREPEKWRWSE